MFAGFSFTSRCSKFIMVFFAVPARFVRAHHNQRNKNTFIAIVQLIRVQVFHYR